MSLRFITSVKGAARRYWHSRFTHLRALHSQPLAHAATLKNPVESGYIMPPVEPQPRTNTISEQKMEEGKKVLSTSNLSADTMTLPRTSSGPYKTPRQLRKKKSKSHIHTPGQAVSEPQEPKPNDGHTDAVVAPSAESGGIPDPRPAYISRALGPPSRLAAPRRILVVMDLNGTVLHRPKRGRSTFVERPHARSFLRYCLDTFHLAIWSSARPHNVSGMVSGLLTADQRRRCLTVWGRDQLGLSPDDYNSRVQVYKRLDRVWEHPDVAAAAARDAPWDQTNTVLVDDSAEKGRSEPFNILALPEFSSFSDESVQVLPQVHDYLNELCWQADVSRYIRQSPFRLNPTYALPGQ